MKRILIFGLMLSSSIALVAQSVSEASLRLTSTAGANDKVKLYEDVSFSNAFDDEYDASKMMNSGMTYSANLYVVCPWGNASKVAEANLDGTKIMFQANEIEGDTYTITFTVSSLVDYQLKDLKTGALTDIVKDGTYSFTQTKSTTEERFEIVKKPAEPTICHQYGNLIITGHKGAKVKVLDMADQVAIAEQTLATDDEVISLSTLTKGEMYQVVVDDGEPMLIRIQ